MGHLVVAPMATSSVRRIQGGGAAWVLAMLAQM
jgi:hypothetical protein